MPDSIVERLKRWKNDRGALANLRCALRPNLKTRAWPLLAQMASLEGPLAVAYETVCGLWASSTESHKQIGNFGVTCRKIRGDHESFDLRFRRLLSCDDREELCSRIVPVALAAQAKGIAIDYDLLFADIKFFGGDGLDRVRTSWAQAYWGSTEAESTDEKKEEAAT
jgi:CRISPR system Cascade subunit CasB